MKHAHEAISLNKPYVLAEVKAAAIQDEASRQETIKSDRALRVVSTTFMGTKDKKKANYAGGRQRRYPTTDKTDITCHHCGKTEHIARNCTGKEKMEKKEQEKTPHWWLWILQDEQSCRG